MNRIGVDLDGVVANFIDGFRDWLKSQGHTHEMPPPDRYNVWEVWGLTKEQWDENFAAACARGLFSTLSPYNGAVESLQKLKSDGKFIHIITYRTYPHVQLDTINWLAKYQVLYGALTFSKEKAGFPLDVMIEDTATSVEPIEKAGVPCYLMDRPWNRSLDCSKRVFSWKEFVEEIS